MGQVQLKEVKLSKACTKLKEPNHLRCDSRYEECANAQSSCLCSLGIHTSASNAHLWQ